MAPSTTRAEPPTLSWSATRSFATTSRYCVRIASNEAIVTFSDTEFSGNSSPYGGGAIVGNGTWNIDRCSFDNNSTPAWGGALYCGGTIDLHVSESTFTSNTAGSLGRSSQLRGQRHHNRRLDRSLRVRQQHVGHKRRRPDVAPRRLRDHELHDLRKLFGRIWRRHLQLIQLTSDLYELHDHGKQR